MPDFRDGFAGIVNKVENSSMLCCSGLRRSMKCERAHQEGFAFFRQTSNLAVGSNMVWYFKVFK